MTMEEKIDFLMNSFIEMKETMTTMQKDIKGLKDDVKELKDDVKELKDDVKKLKDDVKELRQDHENMNRALILIEDDTSNKIPALFDGYSFHQQHIEDNDKRLIVLENEVDEHSIRISALEQIN